MSIWDQRDGCWTALKMKQPAPLEQRIAEQNVCEACTSSTVWRRVAQCLADFSPVVCSPSHLRERYEQHSAGETPRCQDTSTRAERSVTNVMCGSIVVKPEEPRPDEWVNWHETQLLHSFAAHFSRNRFVERVLRA